MSSTSTPTIGRLDPRSASLLEPGDVVAKRYGVLRLLGSGSSAHVYAVRDHRIGREIALKLLRGDVDVKRTLREAEFSLDSSSPRLVRAFDLVEADGLTFLTMALVRGGSLKDRLLDGPLPIDEVIRLGTQVLEGVAALHRDGVLHRDLKPGNLLLTEEGDVKVSDFGIARRWTETSSLTETGTTLGTIDYLSPELAMGIDADPRADLFSCGVVLFEMLTGRVPFEAPTKAAAIGMRLQRRAADVRTLRRDTPRWLAGVVARLLETKREERYASAEDVLRDLRRRRVRVAMPRVRTVTLLAMLAVAAATWWMTREPAVTLAKDGEWGMRGLDRNGDVLWIERDILPTHVAFARRPGKTEIAAFVRKAGQWSSAPEDGKTLRFLNPTFPWLRRSVTLPWPSHAFPEHSERFGVAQVLARDLDRDGYDEVLVTYGHHYYPSFVVVHSLRTGVSRLVFVALGQHRIWDVVDLDGDAVDDLIVGGIANLQGWYTGVAAVRVFLGSASEDAVAFTPDHDLPSSKGVLLWYALCPAGTSHRLGEPTVDRAKRTVSLPTPDGGTVELMFDGFIRAPHPWSVTQRGADREAAYEHLRRARRSLVEDANAAVTNAEAARVLAATAGDDTLAEWSTRVKGTALIHARRFEEADRLFDEVFERSAAASDAAWDAANAYHLVGEVTHAISWYRRSIGHKGHPWFGRLKTEVLQGLVLALGEQGRWAEAEEAIDLFTTMHPALAEAFAWHRRYVAWRSGRAVTAPKELDQGNDLYRYWQLEIALASGANPQAILKEIEHEQQIASETKRLIPLVRAEALLRLGRLDEAFRDADDAYRELQAYSPRYTLDRAHLSIAKERVKRIAAQKGMRWHPTGIQR